ncbi:MULTISPECIES: hypothetical protein [Symbiopectobacterium]|uniref:hypothetical protein n=1 Tax=Symbiopectobacterium TaxID=801 RepID=UPI001A2C8FFB|nr:MULTISPECIES: hypothetical protein [Symbiopectobacterium]MBG6248939.1 hypothetical protein [Candidatus Symbiopectobacterium sp. PLON1]MBT9429043.1 hypothetical protein [Candidatus Symbiopectobacterium endolongispinus]
MNNVTSGRNYHIGKRRNNIMNRGDKYCMANLDRLNKEYNNQILLMINSFAHLEHTLIRAALYRAPIEDRHVIFSPDSKVYAFNCNNKDCDSWYYNHYHREIYNLLKNKVNICHK